MSIDLEKLSINFFFYLHVTISHLLKMEISMKFSGSACPIVHHINMAGVQGGQALFVTRK